MNSDEENPIVFINDIVDIDTGEHLPTEQFGEKILEMIGTTPVEDIEDIEGQPNSCIAHKKDIGLDIYYSVGFTTK